jgi:hypothetical protein
MPDLAVTTIQAVPLPLWMAAALLVLLLVIFFLAVRRSGSFASVGALFGVAALVVIAFSAWKFADHSILRQRAAEREALNARALQLTAAALVPGSPLACLDGVAGEAVNTSCEAAIFRSPETVAAAVAYVEARLRLLADGYDYVDRVDRHYWDALALLRSSLEADRYGFVAHVLMMRDGCSVDSCAVVGWLLGDSGPVKANINARTLENHIQRYAGTWPGQRSSPVAAAPPPELPPALAAIMSGPVTAKPIDFPTAASIPPVSIMTEPPAASASAPAEAAPARRQPAPASAASRPQ